MEESLRAGFWVVVIVEVQLLPIRSQTNTIEMFVRPQAGSTKLPQSTTIMAPFWMDCRNQALARFEPVDERYGDVTTVERMCS